MLKGDWRLPLSHRKCRCSVLQNAVFHLTSSLVCFSFEVVTLSLLMYPVLRSLALQLHSAVTGSYVSGTHSIAFINCLNEQIAKDIARYRDASPACLLELFESRFWWNKAFPCPSRGSVLLCTLHFYSNAAPFLLHSLSLSVSCIHLPRAVLSKRKLTIASEVNATVTSSPFSILPFFFKTHFKAMALNLWALRWIKPQPHVL